MATASVYMELVKIIKAKSKRIATSIDDDRILLGAKEVEQKIKNYCNRSEVPYQLIYTWANIAVDLLLFEVERDTAPDDISEAFDLSDVSTVKIGDTTITLGDKYRSNQRSRILQTHQANLDDLVMNYRQELNQFRRIP